MSQNGHVGDPSRPALARTRLLAELSGQPWRDVVVHETVASTNAELLAAPTPWHAVTADHQSAGRGRLARTWEAPPRAAVAISAAIPLPHDQAVWGWMPLVVGTAIRAAVSQVSAVDVGLKWPNDVLARPAGSAGPWRKLGGILCQTATGAQPVVVVGAGLNIDQEAAELPLEAATSLRQCGAESVDRTAVVAAVLTGLWRSQQAWDDPGELQWLRAAYRAACVTLRQTVDVHLPDGAVRRGEALAVDDTGRLVVRGSDGEVAHAVGDIVHLRPVLDAGHR